MNRMRGWGLLLAVGVPLLIFFSWSRLGAEKSRINLERFEAWAAAAGDSTALTLPLAQYFLERGKLAGPGDAVMPAVPPKIGVKAWAVQADSTVRVELDAKVDGRPVQLIFVPVVRSATAIYYDCVSPFSIAEIGGICPINVVPNLAAIPAQLAANAQVLPTLPTVVSASGVDLPPGTAAGQTSRRLLRFFQATTLPRAVRPTRRARSRWGRGTRCWLHPASTASSSWQAVASIGFITQRTFRPTAGKPMSGRRACSRRKDVGLLLLIQRLALGLLGERLSRSWRRLIGRRIQGRRSGF